VRAFSLAASAFFPRWCWGVFWKRANQWAILGMSAGLGTFMYYMYATILLRGECPLWWGHQPISAGIFGHAGGYRRRDIGSLLTAAEQEMSGVGRPRSLPEPGRRHQEKPLSWKS